MTMVVPSAFPFLLASASAHALLQDIGIAVLTATALGLLAHWTRQPIILGYLIGGALIGPTVGFGLIEDKQNIEIISEIGLILLLFVIGLELKLGALLASGKQLLVAGFGQFLVCAGLGVGLFAALGYGLSGTSSDGLYLALMCALSSTAVVVKLLYDKGELDTIAGRVTLGVLVIQDIYAIFVLAFQPNFAHPTLKPILLALGGTVLLLVAGFLVSKYVLRRVFASIAKSPEMVVAVSIAWCAAVAAAAGALHLSKEMGALVAGLSISAFPYSIHVTAKTLPLRDFFLTLFFVSLGMQIIQPQWQMVGLVLLLVAFVIASRFLSVYPLLAFSGSGRRTAFIASLNLAQISEFSLVIASLGVFYGHIGGQTVGVTIYAMAVTAVLSSYAIRYSHRLYLMFDRVMARLGRGSEVVATESAEGDEAAGDDHGAHPVAVLGVHRNARAFLDAIGQRAPEMLRKVRAIDFNTETLRELGEKGIAGMFGDLSSFDSLEHAHLHDSQLILCTIPDMLLKGTNNVMLVRTLRAIAPRATIVATADDPAHAERLRLEGADYALNPHALVAEELAFLVAETLVGEDGAAAVRKRNPLDASTPVANADAA